MTNFFSSLLIAGFTGVLGFAVTKSVPMSALGAVTGFGAEMALCALVDRANKEDLED